MKSLWKMLVLLMVLSVIVAFPAQVSAQPIDVPQPQDSSDGKVVFGGFYRLESGNTLNGGLVIFGGQGVLEEDSTVNGDVLLTGGSLNVAGEITGDLVAVGGSVDLGDHAIIRGDVTTIGAAINRSDGAVVEGTFSFEMPGNIDFGDAPQLLIPEFNFSPFSYFSEMWRGFQPIRDILWKGFQTLALATLAAILFLFLQGPTERVAKTLVTQPLVSGGLGVLTIFVVPALSLVLILTLILSPLGILGLIGTGLAVLFGWIAIGYEVGLRVSTLVKQNWAPPITAGIGTLTLSILSSIISSIPCIGWVLPALIAMIGLGAVMISRFGTQVYAPKQVQRPAPPVSPAPTSTDFESNGEQNLLNALATENPKESKGSFEEKQADSASSPDEYSPDEDQD